MRARITILLTLLCILASCTKREVIFDTDASEDFELALILNLNGKDCLFDAPSNTLRYSIDEANLTEFAPFTLFQEYSEVKFNGLSLTNNTTNNLGNLALETTYVLEVKTEGETKNLNIVFTTIPLIQIVTQSTIKNEPKTLARMSVYSPDDLDSSVESYIGIEHRGRQSSNIPKKSYGFKALVGDDISSTELMALFNLEPNSKWSLDAMYIDESKVRNKTSYELWNSISTEHINSHYAEVFLNNESLGLYRLSENYTEQSLQMTSNSELFVGKDNTDYTKFEELPNNEPNSATWNDWEQEFPNPTEKISWDGFYNFTELVSDADDTSFINEIETHIDLANVMDYYLFISLCYGYDNAGKNWFFYKESPSSKFKILTWDLDATWGRDHHGEELGFSNQVQNNLFDRLISLNPNGFKENLKTRWAQLRLDEFSQENLIDLFESNSAELQDYQIIEIENQIWDTDFDLNQEQEYINSWVSNRLTFLDSYIDGL